MTLHRFEAVQRVPVPLEEAWAFFSDPRNLGIITPPWMGFRLTSDVPPHIYPGLLVTYRVKPVLGIPVTWVTEISHVLEGRLFVDEQRMGPYRFWQHQHHFAAYEGGTEVRDLVQYSVLPGPPGDLVNRLLVRPKLAEIFGFRRQVLTQRFGAPVRG